jgi:hypothetical protein
VVSQGGVVSDSVLVAVLVSQGGSLSVSLLEGGCVLVLVLVLVLVWLVGGMVTVVESQSSVEEEGGAWLLVVVLMLVSLLGGGAEVDSVQPVAPITDQLVSHQRPLQFSWQGNDVYDVAGGVGQPQFCVTVLTTRQAGIGQVRHWWAVAVMVGQPVGCGGGFVVW